MPCKDTYLETEKLLISCIETGQKFNLSLDKEDRYRLDQPYIRAFIISKILRGEILDIKNTPTKELCIDRSLIIGDIDLGMCDIDIPISISRSVISGKLNLRGASFRDIVLKGTSVNQLNINDARCSGSIILSYGFSTMEPVLARGVKISGQLGCSYGEFGGHPLAIKLESAEASEAFFWRGIKGLWGTVDLTNFRTGILVDDADSWPRKGDLRLTGFRYDNIESNTSPNYFSRLDWLMRQYRPHLTYDFRPQPFEHLADILKESGRDRQAKEIIIQKLKLQKFSSFMRRNERYVHLRHRSENTSNFIKKISLSIMMEESKKFKNINIIKEISAYIELIGDSIYEYTAGYGYKPFRSIIFSIFFIIVGATFFQSNYTKGTIIIIENNDTQKNQSLFFPIAYSTDNFIPLLKLGEVNRYEVDMSREEARSVKYFHWIHAFFGWVFTIIFASSMAGLVKR